MDTRRHTLASLLLVMTAALSSCGTLQPRNHSPTETKAVANIRFYEGLWATQSNFCTTSIFSIPYAYKGFWDCSNDEAKSLKLQNIPAGSTIAVYDSKSCGDDDDYSVITVLKSVPEIVVGDFTHGVINQEAWTMRTKYVNGIAGKVSCAIVDIPGPHPARTKVGEPPEK
jgi:hypothetical protein